MQSLTYKLVNQLITHILIGKGTRAVSSTQNILKLHPLQLLLLTAI